MRRREPGDGLRAALFGGIGLLVALALFAVVFWLTWQLLDYEELGDYLVRLGLSWLFLTFLSFLAFSALVTSLSTFFLSEDLRLLLAAPVPRDRLFYSRFARDRRPSRRGWSWSSCSPCLLAVGLARCAAARYYLARPSSPSCPSCSSRSPSGALVTLVLVNVFPARRARDILMLMGLLFAVALVLLLRFLQPERLLTRGVPARRHRLLRHPAVAGDAAPALLLGRRDPLRRLAREPRRPPPGGPLDHRPGVHRAGPRRLRPLLLRRLEQGPGGAQGPLHPARGLDWSAPAALLPGPPPASSWSRT